MSSDFHEKSYLRHQLHYEDYAEKGDRARDAATWFLDDTVNAWRQSRMHRLIDPLLASKSPDRWLTVGDGRFGQEAHYLLGKGVSAVASDISDTLLKEGARSGYISRYSRQNAESLTYDDGEFDFVWCKESLHHFPRPMKALYEMIRVCRKGVVLIEPADLNIGATLRWKVFRSLVDGARRLAGRPPGHQLFEETGNFVYGISRLEMEKVAMAMNIPFMALRGINDYYVMGLEKEKAVRSSSVFRRIRRRIAMNDLLCRLGFKPHSTLCVMLFLTPPDETTVRHLAGSGFRLIEMPENPYLEEGH